MQIITLNLTNPGVTLTAYIPEQSKEIPQLAKRRAMLVLPGGGYKFCSDREGEPIALEFLNRGFASFVLKYSLGEDSKFPRPLNDAEEALELIRAKADEWHIDPDKVAVIGFSAGGHLASALSTMGRVRPNLQILGYPCILEKISPILSCVIPGTDEQVDSLTPPAFIFASAEDDVVPIENSLRYAEALDRNGIPFEMHIFNKGYHGFSLAGATSYAEKEHLEYNARCAAWTGLCADWMDKMFE